MYYLHMPYKKPNFTNTGLGNGWCLSFSTKIDLAKIKLQGQKSAEWYIADHGVCVCFAYKNIIYHKIHNNTATTLYYM